MADLPDAAWPVVLQHFRGADAAADGAAFREFHRRYLEAHRRAAGTDRQHPLPAARPPRRRCRLFSPSACAHSASTPRRQRALRTSLALFADFRTKQRAAALEKPQQTRAKLPVAAHAAASSSRCAPRRCSCSRATRAAASRRRCRNSCCASTVASRARSRGGSRPSSLARRVSIEGNGEHGVGHQIRFRVARGAERPDRLHDRGRDAAPHRRRRQGPRRLRRHRAGRGARAPHERDVLLGTMARAAGAPPGAPPRAQSATLNPELFSSFFGGAPVLRVPGRAYPVDASMRPAADADVAVADAADGSGAPSRKMLPSRAHELLGPEALPQGAPAD